jgi:hypothetical protein
MDDINLPEGWERFEGKHLIIVQHFSNREISFLDEQGVYYWHKRTGTVTRDRPDSIINSPSLTLSSSSSNETCFEINSLLYKSESDYSIQVNDDFYIKIF